MTKRNGRTSRRLIALVALTGVGVDLATLAWMWGSYDTVSGLTTGQAVLAIGGTIVSASLLALAVALGVVRTRG